MSLSHTACRHCGHWHLWFAGRTPDACLVCSDVRNALPDDGFVFATTDEVEAEVESRWFEAMPGVWGFTTRPSFGLGSIGWLIQKAPVDGTPDRAGAGGGNVAFEAAAWYRRDALDRIAALGGIGALSCSHPHGMGALWQLQQHFSPRVVAMQVDGLRYTKALRVTWPWDDALELAPGLVLHHVGGHYEGHAVLHDAHRRALFAGDTLKIDLDADGRPRALSCHKAYHYQIPLSHGELRRYRSVFAGLPFEHVFTPFEHAAGVTQAHALALFDRLLAGAPSTHPVTLEELVR